MHCFFYFSLICFGIINMDLENQEKSKNNLDNEKKINGDWELSCAFWDGTLVLPKYADYEKITINFEKNNHFLLKKRR